MRWRCTCPFLQHVLGEFRLVPIVAGDAPPEAVAAVFDALWGGPETLIVVSTDLSHYLDYAACQQTRRSRPRRRSSGSTSTHIAPAEACGAVPTRGLLLAARRRGMAIERLDLRNSGDTAGPRDRVVGYGAWALYAETPPPDAGRSSAAVEALGPALIELVAPVDRVRPRHRPAAAGRCRTATCRRCWPRRAPRSSRCAATARCAAASARAVATRPLIVDVVQHAFNAAFRDWRFPRLALAGAGRAGAVGVGADAAGADAVRRSEADLLAQLRPGIDGLIIEDHGRGVAVPAQRVAGDAATGGSS